MAIIHHTTLKPTKLELLTDWLPTRPWYVGDGAPELVKAGGFRLDDPEGEVGIEFMVAVDESGPEPVAYHVPLTYRGAPLPGAEHALVGTMEHGVLGPRWAYDGIHDPVLYGELLALVEGRAQAMAQSITDTPDHEITRSYTGKGFPATPLVPTPDPTPTDTPAGTELPAPDGSTLRINRVLRPDPSGVPPLPPQEAAGHVAGAWQTPEGPRAHALFAVLLAAPGN
ncbi:maltokinase N-terminal cap-like domain-containing protein [Streptomyces sp. CA-249302]|uniref:maltokinase N-terminal cap-like domain-containing protein n=1 Tax=Streptomyces sp. CA-249302 TaxID=3240058 RepID=UPI003D92D922